MKNFFFFDQILELPDSIVESQETIEDTDDGVVHTVTQNTKTTIITGKFVLNSLWIRYQFTDNHCRSNIETEEPSSSLIQFDRPTGFEPQDYNEIQPEVISSTYYQKADNETDDLKMHVEQKGKFLLVC